MGDLTCECASLDGICIHLEALASKAPFTHLMRRDTASQLLQQGSLQVSNGNARLLTCAASANEVQQFHVSVSEGICSCTDWQRNGLCSHLLAAIQLPQFQGITLAMPEPEDHTAEISCSTVFVQPNMASAAVDALCQQHYPKLITASATLAQSLKDKADPQSATVDHECRQLKKVLSVMPDKDAAGLVQQLKDLRVSAQEAAASHALPSKHKQASSGQIFTRQPTDKVTKPLEAGRRHSSGQRSKATPSQRAAKVSQAATAARKIISKARKRVKDSLPKSDVAGPKAYPDAKQKGRPRKHVRVLLRHLLPSCMPLCYGCMRIMVIMCGPRLKREVYFLLA